MKFYVISDPHIYSTSYFDTDENGKHGEVYDQLQRYESREMLMSAFDTIEKSNDADFVIIAGDITNNGELLSHEEALTLLHGVVDKGIKLYLITASHDFTNNADELTYSYTTSGKRRFDIPRVGRDYLREHYFDFGAKDAVAYHESSMSYIIQLQENVRLFMINDDGYMENDVYIVPQDEAKFLWLEEQARIAKEDGQKIIACTHRPLLPNAPLHRLVYSSDLVNDTEKQNRLADMGLQVLFTGHTHMQNIDCFVSDSGNVLYDVNTGAVCGYPPVMRSVEYEPEKDLISIKTVTLDAPDSLDLGGKTFKEYARSRFAGYFERIFNAFEGDIETVATQSAEIHISPELVRKNAFWIMPLGRYIFGLSFGTVGKLLKKESGLTGAELEKLKDKRISDFIIELVLKLFEGDANISPSSDEYKLTMSLMAVIDDFFSALNIDTQKLLKIDSISDFVSPLLINSALHDNDATLTLGKAAKRLPTPPKYESQKGQHALVVACVAVSLSATMCVNKIRRKRKLKK